MNKFSFAGIEIDNLTRQEALVRIEEMIVGKEKGYVVTPNASHIVMLQKDADFMRAYEEASLILPDGMSLVWVSRIKDSPLKERCTGSDLLKEVCRLGAKLGKPIFFLGGTGGSEKLAENRLKRMYPSYEVSSYSPPFGFEHDEEENALIIAAVNGSGVSLLFICVGTPKSEKWIHKHISRLDIDMAFVFGSSLDFFAGIKRRAPVWIRDTGFEWLFRLIQEPGRLWKRYLIGNVEFAVIALKEILKSK